MTFSQRSTRPQVSFSSDLASVLFDTPAAQHREAMERQLVQGLTQILEQISPAKVMRNGPFIDAHIIPHLSGRNLLAAARLIEALAPATVENMPKLRQRREVLRRAHELVPVLSGRNVERLIAVIRDYGGA